LNPDNTSRAAGTAFYAARADMVLVAALALMLAHAVYYLVVGFDRPIYEHHGFRQTQTALSAYWILHGGPWFAYETPVLGAPWSVPFEFPTYQLFVATLAYLGVPLDQAGRLISFGFFIATLYPLRALLRELGYDRTTFLIAAVLFVGCPLYVFWARTFMIESAALFFGVCWLAGLVAFQRRGRALAFALAMAAGCLVAVTKSTTFAGFGGVAGVIVLAAALGAVRAGELRAQRRSLLLLASLCAVPFSAGLAWVAYSDYVKTDNPFAALLTAPSLTWWTYGTLAQRVSGAFWIDVVAKRMGPDIFGHAIVLVPFILLAGFALTRLSWRIPVALCAFLLPLLLFTNLYFHHDYYANANALFLLVAVTLSLSAIFASGWRLAAMLLLACIVVGQSRYFLRTYDSLIRIDARSAEILRISAAAKQAAAPDQALLVLGDLWSSAVPYFSERRALVMGTPLASSELMESVLQRPEAYLGGLRLGGVITCSNLSAYYAPPVLAELAKLLAGRAVLAEAGSCRLYAGQ
jgi:hypothetical protein